ncbi:unnamed protein product [Notodromas monacha]|uniref:Uncharacterized protein n=1 Tax=Notodromas monacha TaxID=399045 RepID=A0A7R9BXB3_9CRUS|nr:unnamed protein product [Notodromas monacha]CAG0922109.1 unnamed protein product [Notodromas monacha]
MPASGNKHPVPPYALANAINSRQVSFDDDPNNIPTLTDNRTSDPNYSYSVSTKSSTVNLPNGDSSNVEKFDFCDDPSNNNDDRVPPQNAVRQMTLNERPPLVKSISVLMRGKFNTFCQDATIHGLGNIRRADKLITKLSWAAVVLVQTGFLAYIFITYLDAYWNYHVQKGSTELSWEEQTEMELPDVTICASSPFKRSAINDLHVNGTFMAYLLLGFGAGAYVRQDFAESKELHEPMKLWLDEILAAKNTTYKGLVMDLALRCEDVILQCSYDGKELSRDECCETVFPKPAITSHGPCLSSHGNVHMQKIFGRKGGITFILKTDDYSMGLDSRLLTDAGDVYGYSVTVTHPATVPSTLTTTANKGAPAGMKTSMELTKTVEDWSGLVMPSFRGQPKVCVDLSSQVSVLEYSKIIEEYSEWRGNCLLRKLFELSESSCRCRLIDDPRIDNNSVRICEPQDIINCSLPQLYEDPTELPTMFEMLKIRGRGAETFSAHCLPLCREISFKSTMSYELLSRKFISDMKTKHDLSDEDEILIIKLFFTDTNYNTIVHKSYTLLDCFGTIGGYMGLLLGASMISVVETTFFIVKFIYEFLALYFSRVRCHSQALRNSFIRSRP